LFPTVVDAPTFEIQRVGKLGVNYLFLSSDDAQRFLDKYNGFVDELLKLKAYGNSMSEEVNATCLLLYKGKSPAPVTVKGANPFFSTSKDVNNCNAYIYYYSRILGRLKYVTNGSLDEYYFAFASDAVKDAKASKLKPIDDKEASDIKTKAKKSLNLRKVIKYSIFLFGFSIMVAFILAFVFEFWTKNKDRISGYWR